MVFTPSLPSFEDIHGLVTTRDFHRYLVFTRVLTFLTRLGSDIYVYLHGLTRSSTTTTTDNQGNTKDLELMAR